MLAVKKWTKHQNITNNTKLQWNWVHCLNRFRWKSFARVINNALTKYHVGKVLTNEDYFVSATFPKSI